MKKSVIFVLIGLLVLVSITFLIYSNKINGYAIKDTSLKCKDSDGGDAPFTKGIVSHKILSWTINYEDKCLNKNQLKEYFCTKNNLKIAVHNCENGCSNGACENLEPPSEQKNVLFIVDSTISTDISKELSLFKQNLEEDNNWKITIKEFSPNTDKKEIKEFILDRYNKDKIFGVFLIGNIPTGEFISQEPLFPILADYYYVDVFNDCGEINQTIGTWECHDPQKNMNFTLHYPCEQSGMITITSQEITKTLLSDGPPCAMPFEERPFFVSRITPNSDEEGNSELIKQFILRDIDFRTGKKTFQHRALIYIPIFGENQDAAYRERETNEFVSYLTGNYKDMKIEGAFVNNQIKLINPETENSDDEFLQEVKQNYEYLFYEGHGDHTGMQKFLTPDKVKNTSTLIGNFFSCSVGRFSEKDYIIGEFLFKGNMLFTNAASTPVGRSVSPNQGHFTYLLSKGIPIFDALVITSPFNTGLNNLGDATIRTTKPITKYSSADPKISIKSSLIDFGEIQNGNLASISLTFKNLGKSDLIIHDIQIVINRKDKEHRLTDLTSQVESNRFKIVAQGSREINVGISPTASLSGLYYGKIYIISNDPVYPIKEIPFKINIK